MKPLIHYLERGDVWKKIRVTDFVKIAWRIVTQIAMLTLGLPVCAVGLLFCRSDWKVKHMPRACWFFDNDVDTINGDPGWWAICKRTWWLGLPTSWWSRWYWTAIRNPCRNYSMWVGARPCDIEEIWINKQYDEDPHRRQCNSLIVKARTWDDKYYMMWMPVLRLTKERTVVGKFGFKLWDLVPLAKEGSKQKCQFVFYPSFTHQKGGKL